jgi:transcriptional regulator EpsA
LDRTTDVLKQAERLEIDLGNLMSILARAVEVRDSDGLLTLLNSDVQRLFRNECMVCGFGVVTGSGNYVQNVLHRNYPPGYFQGITTNDGRAESPLIQRWRLTQEPVVFQGGRDDHAFPEEWVALFNKYNLQNTIGHGALDARRLFGSYFIFSTIPGEVGDREVFILKMITPHLHLALIRSLATFKEVAGLSARSDDILNVRQKEILWWINEGKTNWEIAQILKITQKSVKYHIEQIFAKLEVRNRTQAVSKAIFLGILS